MLGLSCKELAPGMYMRWVGIAAAWIVFSLSPPAQAALLVSVDKTQQQLTVTIDGAETYRWPVSTGKDGYDTPGGSFRAYRMEPVWFSTKFDDAPMPNSVFFHGGYAVHGTLEQSRLGRPVSHGCVRLSRENAQLLYDLVKKHGLANTRVVVSGAITVANMRMPEPRRDFRSVLQKTKAEARGSRAKQKIVVRYVTRQYQFDDTREQRLRRQYREAGFRW